MMRDDQCFEVIKDSEHSGQPLLLANNAAFVRSIPPGFLNTNRFISFSVTQREDGTKFYDCYEQRVLLCSFER